MGLFCQNLLHTLENYFNFTYNVFGSILEINYYYRIEENVSFTELSKIIKTLSNADFAALDKFNKLENLF